MYVPNSKDASESPRYPRKYNSGMHLTSVSQIDLAADSNDQIEEFSVEFQYSYWTVESGGAEGDAIP